MKKMKKTIVLLVALTCVAGATLGQNGNSNGNTNNSKGNSPRLGSIVVIGDSLSAGFQNGTLLDCQQPNGYANLVVNQAVSSGAAAPRLSLPLMKTGVPPFHPPDGIPDRDIRYLQATDLAVPGSTVGQALTLRPVYSPSSVFPFATYGVQTMANFVLGFPGVFTSNAKSQVEWANTLNPDTIILWLGSNDVLGLFEGVQSGITDPVTFARNYDQVVSSVIKNNRRIVVANLPDITLTPFMAGLLPQLQQQDPLIALKLKAYVLAYNTAIYVIAAKNHLPVVDVYSLVNKLAAKGYKAGIQELTTQQGGGLFSLDGVHPTNTGYALVANEFIKTINTAYGTDIQPVDVVSIANVDPLTPYYLQGGFLGYCAAVPAVLKLQ